MAAIHNVSNPLIGANDVPPIIEGAANYQKVTPPLMTVPEYLEKGLEAHERAEFDGHCRLCYEDFTDDDDDIVKVGDCGHEFHRACMVARFDSTEEDRDMCWACGAVLCRMNPPKAWKLAAYLADEDENEDHVVVFNRIYYIRLMALTDEMYQVQSTKPVRDRNWRAAIFDVVEAYWMHNPGQYISNSHMEDGDHWIYLEVARRFQSHIVYNNTWEMDGKGTMIDLYIEQLRREVEPDKYMNELFDNLNVRDFEGPYVQPTDDDLASLFGSVDEGATVPAMFIAQAGPVLPIAENVKERRTRHQIEQEARNRIRQTHVILSEHMHVREVLQLNDVIQIIHDDDHHSTIKLWGLSWEEVGDLVIISRPR